MSLPLSTVYTRAGVSNVGACAQKFEKGGGHFKAKPAGPDIVMSQKYKKGHNARADVQFSAQRQVKSKEKTSSRP